MPKVGWTLPTMFVAEDGPAPPLPCPKRASKRCGPGASVKAAAEAASHASFERTSPPSIQTRTWSSKLSISDHVTSASVRFQM